MVFKDDCLTAVNAANDSENGGCIESLAEVITVALKFSGVVKAASLLFWSEVIAVLFLFSGVFANVLLLLPVEVTIVPSQFSGEVKEASLLFSNVVMDVLLLFSGVKTTPELKAGIIGIIAHEETWFELSGLVVFCSCLIILKLWFFYFLLVSLVYKKFDRSSSLFDK